MKINLIVLCVILVSSKQLSLQFRVCSSIFLAFKIFISIYIFSVWVNMQLNAASGKLFRLPIFIFPVTFSTVRLITNC